MSRRNKLWTRERITLALTRFVAEYGVEQLKNYVIVARQAGRGLATSERPYPSDQTVRVEFPTMADAWRAAGVDMPEKVGRGPRVKANGAAAPKPTKGTRSVGVVGPGRPATTDLLMAELAELRAERDVLAGLVAGFIRGDLPTEQVLALRAVMRVGETRAL